MANNNLIASDTFASGSMAAGWAANSFGLIAVVGGSPGAYYAQGANTTTAGAQIWTGLSWPDDQTVEIKVQAAPNTGGINLMARWLSTTVISGYALQIQKTSVTLNVYSAGVPTQLWTDLAITTVAGDVWTLQAAGSVISVYQNGVRKTWVNDTTWTAGTPGFWVSDPTQGTYSHISWWKGYSCVQQDGIWHKQGVIIPANAADLAIGVGPAGMGIANPSAVLYEGGSQLGLGGGNVYKMWFTRWSTPAIMYAESLDGLTWTRRTTAVLSAWSNGSLLKVASTYYLYVQAGVGTFTGDFASYTSSDGITWAQQSTSALVKGAAGQFDSTTLFWLQVIYSGGTFYGLYNGSGTGSGQGLATSADGITFTKYGSNPVSSPTPFGGITSAVNLVNGQYYWWCGQARTTSPATGGGLGLVRASTPDFINWTPGPHSINPSQLFEGLHTALGEVAPGPIIDIGGRAHWYYTSAAWDGAAPDSYQIGLAIGPSPIATIVTGNEDSLTQIASDDFTSGAGDLSANWTTITGGTKLKIVAGPYVEATATGTGCGMSYTGASFADNQYSEITIQTLASTQQCNPCVRVQPGATTYYSVVVTGPTGSSNNSLEIAKVVAGVGAAIVPFVPITPVVGDKIRLEVFTGSSGNPILSVYQNGFLAIQTEDYTNAIPSGGAPGMIVITSDLAQAQISGWTGGNFVVSTLISSVAVNGGVDVSAGTTFNVVVTTNSNVIQNTGVSIATTTGEALGGTTTGTITAGTNSVTFGSISLAVARTGVIIEATNTSGDFFVTTDSAAFNVVANTVSRANTTALGTKYINTAFSVRVDSTDGFNNSTPVTQDTAIVLAVGAGTGSIAGGATTGTILSGTSTITITGVKYSKVENSVELTATSTSGDSIGPLGVDTPFNVTAAPTTSQGPGFGINNAIVQTISPGVH